MRALRLPPGGGGLSVVFRNGFCRREILFSLRRGHSARGVPAATTALCPRCRVDMQAVVIGKTNLRECPKCEGIWADTASLQQIYADREQQAAVLGTAAPLPDDDNFETNVRYVPCPVCNKLMNRVNFAHCSHVIVDVCREHGTWSTRMNCGALLNSFAMGGLEMARADEMEELEQKRRALRAAQIAAPPDSPLLSRQKDYNDLGGGIASVARTPVHLISGLRVRFIFHAYTFWY